MIPFLKSAKISEEKSGLHFPLQLCLPETLDIDRQALESVCPGTFLFSQSNTDILFSPDEKADFDYRITVQPQKATVQYKNSASAFYALVTLFYFRAGGRELPCFSLVEMAEVENRGFLLDISRGRVPKLETLKQLADILARFRYNQLQLYIEGFSFYYPSFSQYCDTDSALCGDEIRELDAYCAARFIELVPCQNTLGHMAPWLSKKEFTSLAECENGFCYHGHHIVGTTLDASDPKALRHVETMSDDLFTVFSSKKIHFGLDEPFEFCRCKNRDENPKTLLLSYVEKLRAFAYRSGRHMMMWTDSLFKYGAVSPALPKDITYMEWGYEQEYPFNQRCAALRDAGVGFYVCPGTSSWRSFTGITDNMLKNVENALRAAVSYGAKGILLTDWGDENHMQPLCVSMPAVVYCAALCWNSTYLYREEDLVQALDRFVFETRSGSFGRILLEAGRYHNLEEMYLPCRTLAHLCYSSHIQTREQYETSLLFTGMLNFVFALPQVAQAYEIDGAPLCPACAQTVCNNLEKLQQQLQLVQLSCPNDKRVLAELKNALQLAHLFTAVRLYIAGDKPLGSMQNTAKSVCAVFKRLWLQTSKPGGLQAAVLAFDIMFGPANKMDDGETSNV